MAFRHGRAWAALARPLQRHGRASAAAAEQELRRQRAVLPRSVRQLRGDAPFQCGTGAAAGARLLVDSAPDQPRRTAQRAERPGDRRRDPDRPVLDVQSGRASARKPLPGSRTQGAHGAVRCDRHLPRPHRSESTGQGCGSIDSARGRRLGGDRGDQRVQADRPRVLLRQRHVPGQPPGHEWHPVARRRALPGGRRDPGPGPPGGQLGARPVCPAHRGGGRPGEEPLRRGPRTEDGGAAEIRLHRRQPRLPAPRLRDVRGARLLLLARQ